MCPGRRGLRFTSAKVWGVLWKTYQIVVLSECAGGLLLEGEGKTWRLMEGEMVYLACHVEGAEENLAAWEGWHGLVLLVWHWKIARGSWNGK